MSRDEEEPEDAQDDPEDENELHNRWDDDPADGRISLAHAVNLIVAGLDAAEKLNQKQALMQRLPDLKDRYDTLCNLLMELGFEPQTVIRGSKRLSAFVDGLYVLLPGIDASAVYFDTLDFTIAGSPLLSSRRLLRAHVRRLPRKAPVCLLRLADGVLRISIRDWGISIPAVFETSGACFVRRGFLDILLLALDSDEVIRCHVEPGLYSVNRFTHRVG